MLWFWNLFSAENILTALILFILSLFGLGCSDSAEKNVRYWEMGIEAAERHNLAYTATLHVGGRPSVGSSVDFYANTDVTGTVTVQGNAAGARLDPKPDPVGTMNRLEDRIESGQ